MVVDVKKVPRRYDPVKIAGVLVEGNTGEAVSEQLYVWPNDEAVELELLSAIWA